MAVWPDHVVAVSAHRESMNMQSWSKK